MNWCRNSRTSTKKKEVVRLDRRKLIGSRAEKDMRAYLLASGIELGPDEDLYSRLALL
jgi:hypothetical protein